ncbi:MAG: iron ABC transporter permease [Clostridia bacterium]|nr:iron ABC transporter permease [Clostridia bacterium]
MKKYIPHLITMTACLALAVLFGTAFGSTHLSFSEVWQGVLGKDELFSVIVRNLRLPRVFAALLAGVGLSVSGVLLQSVTGNPLAAPNIIGVNAGAGFATILMLTLFSGATLFAPLFAFAGAFVTTLIIVFTANRIGASSSTVILAGIAFSAILNAGISFLSLLDSDVLTAYNAFSIGGLRGVTANQLYLPAFIITAGLTFSLLISRHIRLLSLGDKMAASLGVRVRAIRFFALLLASASAAAVVSFAGLLGFVGLVVPHIARRIVGTRTSILLIASSLIGASLVIFADLFGRILLAPTEIPVGIIMALIGAPFFFILLIKRRNTYAEM